MTMFGESSKSNVYMQIEVDTNLPMNIAKTATILTLPLPRLLSAKAQGCKDL